MSHMLQDASYQPASRISDYCQVSLVQSTSKKLSIAVSVNVLFNPVEPTLQMTSQVILEAPDGK